MSHYLSNYDYRFHSLYTHIVGTLADGKASTINLRKIHSQSSATDLHLSTLSWSDAAAMLHSLDLRSIVSEQSGCQDICPKIKHEYLAYSNLLKTLSYFKRRHCPLLSEHIESFQLSSIPLQEFRIYLDSWQFFGPPAKTHPFLSLMAFYSAVAVGDLIQAQYHVADARRIFSTLPTNSLLYIMTSNIFCLYLIKTGRPLVDVLRLNSSIISKTSRDESEALSILLLNRARLMARLGSSSQALRNLQLSFSLRCELAAPPLGLILLYLLYYLRWSNSCITYTNVFDLIGVPGLSSLSWRMSGLLNLPSQTKLILVNRHFAVTGSISSSTSLSDWATYVQDSL